VQLALPGQHGPVDLNTIDQFVRSPPALDRQLDRVKARVEIDVLRVGYGGRLSVAEVPLNPRIERERFRGLVDELHPDQRDFVVRQGHVAGDADQEVGHEPGALRGDDPRLDARDRTTAKHLARYGLRCRLGVLGRDLPRRNHQRLRPTGGVIVFELVGAGRELDVFARAAYRPTLRTVTPRGLDHEIPVDQQEAAILTGCQEAVHPGGGDVQVAGVVAQERLRLQRERIERVVDVCHVIRAERFGRLKRAADRFQAVEIALTVLASFEHQPRGVRPSRHLLLVGGIAAVVDLVVPLGAPLLKGQPAVVAGTKL